MLSRVSRRNRHQLLRGLREAHRLMEQVMLAQPSVINEMSKLGGLWRDESALWRQMAWVLGMPLLDQVLSELSAWKEWLQTDLGVAPNPGATPTALPGAAHANPDHADPSQQQPSFSWSALGAMLRRQKDQLRTIDGQIRGLPSWVTNWKRLTYTLRTWWRGISFSTLLGLSVLTPIAYNITDKYVMSRVNYGSYLANDVRLAYEDFYYTATSMDSPPSRSVILLANKFLNKISRLNATNNYRAPLGDYGVENRNKIALFVFSLRVIALTCMSTGILPEYLPKPCTVEEIARSIQKFMSAYAWKAFLRPQSMTSNKLELPASYAKLMQGIRGDSKLWAIFSKDCNEICLKRALPSLWLQR